MQQEDNQNTISSLDSAEKLSPREHFEKEMAEISFQELQKFFAKGLLVTVDKGLSLVDVAMQVHADNATQIKTWLDDEKLIRAHDEHAQKWVAQRSVFNAVTVAPWVLVQEIIS